MSRNLTADDYGRIRRAHGDGMGIREIAREFHHSRYKVREVLRENAETIIRFRAWINAGRPE